MAASLGILAQIIGGWFVADLITALVHLTLDNAGAYADAPIVGKVVRDFQVHHLRPRFFLRYSFWYSCRETLIASLLAVGLACLFAPWFWGTVAVGTGLCQESHRWAHRQERPWVVRLLQTCRVMLHPAHHDYHHGHFTRSFGILNAWSNLPLNGVLRLGEWAMQRGH